MKVSVYYDIVCPWCFIGHKRLLDAVKAYPAEKIQLDYRPFQLAPDAEKELTLDAYYAKRGMDPTVMKKSQGNVAEIGKGIGITFNYERLNGMFNTLDAHRLIKLAPQEKKTSVVTALFEGYFAKGLNYGRIADLAKVGAEAGLGSVEELKKRLQSDEMAEAVRNEVKHAYTMPIITVPYMLVDEKWPIQFIHMEGVAEFALRNLVE